jgi:hypothetical protein
LFIDVLCLHYRDACLSNSRSWDVRHLLGVLYIGDHKYNRKTTQKLYTNLDHRFDVIDEITWSLYRDEEQEKSF